MMLVFLALHEVLILLLGFCFSDAFSFDILQTGPKVQNNELRATFEFFSKRSKAAWEYRRDHTDHHSSGESAQLKKSKFSEVLSGLGGYVFIFLTLTGRQKHARNECVRSKSGKFLPSVTSSTWPIPIVSKDTSAFIPFISLVLYFFWSTWFNKTHCKFYQNSVRFEHLIVSEDYLQGITLHHPIALAHQGTFHSLSYLQLGYCTFAVHQECSGYPLN